MATVLILQDPKWIQIILVATESLKNLSQFWVENKHKKTAPSKDEAVSQVFNKQKTYCLIILVCAVPEAVVNSSTYTPGAKVFKNTSNSATSMF